MKSISARLMLLHACVACCFCAANPVRGLQAGCRTGAPQAEEGGPRRRLLPLRPGPHVRGAGGDLRPQRAGQQGDRGIPAGDRRRSHFRVPDLRPGRTLCQDRPHSRCCGGSAGHSQARSQQPGSPQTAGPDLSALAGRHAGRQRLAERAQAGHRAVRADRQDRARQRGRPPAAGPPLPPEQRPAKGGNEFKTAVKLEPDSEEAVTTLAYLYNEEGDTLAPAQV